jgi:DNA-binding NarL/FixJ family response regulator
LEIQRDARAAIREYELGRTLLPQVHDPFLRTAFLNQHAYVLATLARYDDALEIARELIIEARASGLEFAVHHALVTRATAFVGTRQLQAAQRTLDELDGAAERPAEHVLANANLQLAKLRIALGDLDRASRLLHVRPSLTMSVSFKQELLAYRAVVDAARGDLDAATAALEEGATEAVYGATIGVRKFAAAIVELRNDSDRAPTAALTAMQFAIARGFIDGAVSACRAYPELARHAATQDADSASQLAEIFRRTRDSDLGRRAGLTMPRELHRNEGLSVREREVYEHLIQGRTNREIAAALFISESTTKVHVRHIFEKLGVHSRAEAARLAGRLDGETRAAVMSHIEDPDR